MLAERETPQNLNRGIVLTLMNSPVLHHSLQKFNISLSRNTFILLVNSLTCFGMTYWPLSGSLYDICSVCFNLL